MERKGKEGFKSRLRPRDENNNPLGEETGAIPAVCLSVDKIFVETKEAIARNCSLLPIPFSNRRDHEVRVSRRFVSCIEFDDSPPMLEKERKKTEGLGKLRPSFLPLRFRPSAFPFPFHPSFLLSFTGQEYLNTMPPRRDRHCLFATTLWKRLRLTVEYL